MTCKCVFDGTLNFIHLQFLNK